ncbi:MAG: hypothetical protein V4481_05135 [Patescibacteria group bacterium]
MKSKVNEDNSQQACCAHINVKYKPIENDNGLTSCNWECVICDTKFVPIPLNARKIGEEGLVKKVTVSSGGAEAMAKIASIQFSKHDKKEDKWSLKYCEKCIQMTNHRQDLCLKCYKKAEKHNNLCTCDDCIGIGVSTPSTMEERFDKIQESTNYSEYTHKRFCCGGDYCKGDHLGFIKSFIQEELERARGEERKRIEKKYKDIFDWLHGLNGEFPDLSQKPHYRFRSELDKKIKDINSKEK